MKSAFASYSSKDQEKVASIVGALRQVNIDFFLDCLDLRPGEAWKKRLREEIEKREKFWLFWSEAAAASKWVEWEWRTALRLKKKAGILPYALLPAPNPPKALSSLQFSSVEAAISELAARRRADKGGSA
jgi:hypothetical protein